ncbi:choloylglycine hydrolase family protein [uncultured Clostridium sp.]|uniref:choloylglycine hydrolase family protein n=1 Tax=uncultured Clostridium sp. TaxID=59620 RepID=UPI00260F9C37|nr:choloylglycine hydrolase family protein [uncultured Clostridium sp.]
MCTSLTLKSEDNKNFLARTMDFPLAFDESVHLIPRDFKWYSVADKKEQKSKYASLGMSVVMNNHPILADGVNEKGLCVATLYFPGFAHYEKNLSEDKINLAPYDFVYYALANCSDLEEVSEMVKNVEFIDVSLSFLGLTPPLHWIVTDRSGKSITIENTIDGLKITDNQIGVMTNSPEIGWHFTNLRQYIGVKPTQNNPVNWAGLDLSAFSQGGGTFSIPGDYTPPSRFVRAAYLKSVSVLAKDEIDGVTSLFHILANCEVPKGAVLKDGKELDFTLYTAAMCSESCTYYYKTYENSQISAISMSNEDLNRKDIKAFENKRKQKIECQN